MTLPLELGSIQDPYIRRAFEQIAQQFPDPPNLAAAFTTWKTIMWCGSSPGSASITAAATYLMAGGSQQNASAAPATIGSAASGVVGFRLDPADWIANIRTTKLRVRWQYISNATAPAVTITPGLYPVGAFGGAAGAAVTITSVGTVVSGSTASFASPGASSNTVTLSSEFNAPAALDYVFGVAMSGAYAANSVGLIFGQLQMRQV